MKYRNIAANALHNAAFLVAKTFGHNELEALDSVLFTSKTGKAAIVHHWNDGGKDVIKRDNNGADWTPAMLSVVLFGDDNTPASAKQVGKKYTAEQLKSLTAVAFTNMVAEGNKSPTVIMHFGQTQDVWHWLPNRDIDTVDLCRYVWAKASASATATPVQKPVAPVVTPVQPVTVTEVKPKKARKPKAEKAEAEPEPVAMPACVDPVPVNQAA